MSRMRIQMVELSLSRYNLQSVHRKIAAQIHNVRSENTERQKGRCSLHSTAPVATAAACSHKSSYFSRLIKFMLKRLHQQGNSRFSQKFYRKIDIINQAYKMRHAYVDASKDCDSHHVGVQWTLCASVCAVPLQYFLPAHIQLLYR